jgi:hypothetical protein
MSDETSPLPEAHDDDSSVSLAPGSRLKAVAPWLGAIGIFAYLFWDVPFDEAWEAAQNARLDLFVPEILVAVVFWFLLDSRALAYLLTRFNAPVSWPEARSIRGVTYLATVLNWNVGTAAIVLHLRRSKNVPALESTSSLFFYGNCDALLLMGLTLVGATAFSDSATLETIRKFAAIAFAVQLTLFFLLAASFPGWRWLGKMRKAALVRSYRLATLRDVSIVLSIKFFYFMVFLWIFWAGSHAFGIEIPFSLAMASAPAIMMVAALPISPAGLGTQAAAMVFFWSDYGEKAEILAFGMVFPIALTLARCLLGLPYLKDLRSLRQAD